MAPEQIDNLNHSVSTNFIFSIENLPKCSFFCQKANIPGITGQAIMLQQGRAADLPVPGGPLVFSGVLNISFMVDENFLNYVELQKWMRSIYHATGIQPTFETAQELHAQYYSTANLQILNNAKNPVLNVHYFNCFPTSLSDVDFTNETEGEAIIATATFAYHYYNLIPVT